MKFPLLWGWIQGRDTRGVMGSPFRPPPWPGFVKLDSNQDRAFYALWPFNYPLRWIRKGWWGIVGWLWWSGFLTTPEGRLVSWRDLTWRNTATLKERTETWRKEDLERGRAEGAHLARKEFACQFERQFGHCKGQP